MFLESLVSKLVIVAWMGCFLKMHFKKVFTMFWYQQVCSLRKKVSIGKKGERVGGFGRAYIHDYGVFQDHHRSARITTSIRTP